ncbi:DUF6079 family protein [Treponema primitia]|uniref:DUF6079 family protein n=1 Tax=Treponema primitia TaxID=88058 RepID=UPI0002554BFF|nr:DUF6079 family protein [Treponema primitia]
MKYADLISFNPIESVLAIAEANDKSQASNLVKSYVMSDDMAEKLQINMLSQLKLEDVVDNKGVFLVGNYGTGKTHLMSVISAVANDADNLAFLQNKKFADYAKNIAGKFEVLRFELSAVKTSLRQIVLSRLQEDLKGRGLSFSFPKEDETISNKDVLKSAMELFSSKHPDKGYLIVIDEFLDFLGGKDDHAVRYDLGFMRELGEIVKETRLRIILGVQEKLYDNPNFSFVSQTINKIKDRFEQVVIRKEDTAYVVAESILKKTADQKAIIREHLQKFTSLYSNMDSRIEEYVDLFPIHPSYIDVFNKIYMIENRHILKNVSEIIRRNLDNILSDESTGVISFDSYWSFIKENNALHTDPNIKEVVDKSGKLEDILNRSFPKKLYKPLAVQIIFALSVHRLTTGDTSIRAGLTSENLRDDLCLYLPGMPDQTSDTLQSIVQTVLKDIMTTVSGQYIDSNPDNGQYYLELTKDIDYDEKINQRAAVLADDSLNNYYYDLIYSSLEWDIQEYVPGFKIYEHALNWQSHNIFRKGYLFLGTPVDRPTAQPPRDYYIYFIPPYGTSTWNNEKKDDEVFFFLKPNESFKNDLKLYAAALLNRDFADDKNKAQYQGKAEIFKKKLLHYFSENKNTGFEVIFKGEKKQPLEIIQAKYNKDSTFVQTIDLIATICLDGCFSTLYPLTPLYKTNITLKNLSDTVRSGIEYIAGRKTQIGAAFLDSFGLIDTDSVSIKNSKYAQYYLQKLEALPEDTVINFTDIYENISAEYIDKQFKISYDILPVVFLSLVYSGKAVLSLKNTIITASNIENLVKTPGADINEFKYLSRPKDVQLTELAHLFDVLGLQSALILNPATREKALDKLLAEAKVLTDKAVIAASKLNDNFELWGEPLSPSHIAAEYKISTKSVSDTLGNFHARFNTVAKLNNFTLSTGEIDKLAKDIGNVKIVGEYETLKAETYPNVLYMVNLESIDLGAAIRGEIEAAKEAFRKIRDAIPQSLDGITGAQQINETLSKVKEKYINLYFEEHKKKRLNNSDAKKKGDIIASPNLTALKQLRKISILSTSKLDTIEKELASLKVCYELTTDMLKTSHFCTKCNFMLGAQDLPIHGKLEELSDRIDTLLAEWNTTLLNTVSDPLVLEQKQYLSADQQKCIDDYIAAKKLPQTIDQFFVNAIIALLHGFEPVTIPAMDLIDKLDALGPCEVEKFKVEITGIINSYTEGKDKSKLRIVIKR